ncbi:hypothetical protein Pcinc_003382 [Petrolisthes cinctipes]|uniref:Uncharacterized protein n=1 Tax=Petrolisthes cinctipes TaxID=88211 RepID=A0AAE1L1D5_PETCI|nr:hypothetical protein Pcinc_003382 [Petrolisthes cinctipes]
MAPGRRNKKPEEASTSEEGALSQDSNVITTIGGTGRHNTTTVTTTTTTTTSVPDVTEIINQELSNTNLPGDMQALVTIIGKVIQTQFDTYFSKVEHLITANNRQIDQMQTKINKLENKIINLETTIDDVDQYERRDTVIISGPSLPDESTNENPCDLIVNTIKHHLHVNMTHADINVAHRIGRITQGKTRPIIVKLQNRIKKSELVQACITVKPQLYINESLTPKRREIYTVIRRIRTQHKHLFQQCHTSDGRIIVKLKNSTIKHTITNDQSLAQFLDNHPIFKNTAENMN